MPEDSFIETGVDKLVRLVESKKKVSTTDAAKILGVSSAVIDEWADFLEEEGLISIEYKLATTYLVERKLSKKEVVKKAKEFHGTKDAFIRKIETTIHGIDRDTSGLEELKEQFQKLKKDIGDDLSNVKDELKELENYEKLKKNIDKQIYEQQKEFKKRITDMEKELFREKSKYKELVDDIDVEKIKLEEERSEVLSLKEQEHKLLKRLEDFSQTVKQIRDAIKEEEDKIDITEEHIGYLEKLSDKVKHNILKQREKLNPLAEESRKQEASIVTLQEEVLKKVIKGRKRIDSEVADSAKIAEHFRDFFEKKSQIDSLLQKIDNDKEGLEMELQTLIKRAQAFDLASKSSSVQKHMVELNSKFKEIEKKRSRFKGELDKLVRLVKRNF